MTRRLLRPHSPGGRPRVLFSERDPAFRMQAIDRTRDRYEIITVPAGVDPVRKARTEGPEVVLLSVEPGGIERTLRAVRVLKGELEPPTVGVLNLEHARLKAVEVMEGCGADGYLLGRPDWETFEGWLDALYRGERPVIALPKPGLLDRLTRKLRP
jgi:DNA-binding NarL/FixJ family response regulator